MQTASSTCSVAVVATKPNGHASSAPLPETRGDCVGGSRPCPLVRCKWNTYLDVLPSGRPKFNHLGIEPWEADPRWSCALDVADRGGATLAEVGQAMGLTRERARQIEVKALIRVRRLTARLSM